MFSRWVLLLGFMIVAVVIFFSWESAGAQFFPPPLCGKDPTGQTDHCYARRRETSADVAIRGVTGVSNNPARPCVPPTCSDPPCEEEGPHFSAFAAWVGDKSPTRLNRWVEMGVIKHDNGNNTFDPRWYSRCGRCGMPLNKEGEEHGKARGGDNFTMWYDPDTECWSWWLNKEQVRAVCNAQYQLTDMVGYGANAYVGGETTTWYADMGVSDFHGLQIFEGSSWHAWDPDADGGTRNKVAHYVGRYVSRYFPTSPLLGSLLHVYSDTHVTLLPSVCESPPPPTATVGPTSTPAPPTQTPVPSGTPDCPFSNPDVCTICDWDCALCCEFCHNLLADPEFCAAYKYYCHPSGCIPTPSS